MRDQWILGISLFLSASLHSAYQTPLQHITPLNSPPPTHLLEEPQERKNNTPPLTNPSTSQRQMRKLCKGKGKRVHPSPPSPLLPAAVLSMAAALTAEEQEVLAYLVSAGGGGGKERQGRRKQKRAPHEPEAGCGCFECYKSFWSRWDASPNRHVIHLIIDAFEETLESEERALAMAGSGGRRRRAGRRRGQVAADPKGLPLVDGGNMADDDGSYDGSDDDEEAGEQDDGKSSVRRLVSFIGERVWGVWN